MRMRTGEHVCKCLFSLVAYEAQRGLAIEDMVLTIGIYHRVYKLGCAILVETR